MSGHIIRNIRIVIVTVTPPPICQPNKKYAIARYVDEFKPKLMLYKFYKQTLIKHKGRIEVWFESHEAKQKT